MSEPWEIEHRQREWGRWPDESLIRYVARHAYHLHPRDEIHFLDVGCGAGANSNYLRKEGFTVRAIDFSEKAIDRTREFIPQNKLFGAQVAKATELPFGENRFDFAVDVCCLQHLDDDDAAKALSEIARVLKPAGRLFSRHTSAHGWSGIHTVGSVYPRRAVEIAELYGRHFDCDYMHDIQERLRHPENKRKVLIAHWNIEGIKHA